MDLSVEVGVGPDVPAGSDGADLFAAGGGAGRIMAGIDWASTPLGPVAGWPASLRFAVRTVLVSRFPMVLTWGPDFLQFYNDAYAPLIGAKHPAIGQDIRQTLAEGWDALGPPVEHAMATCEASWLPGLLLLLERAGYREETYFTVSHAPAFDDDGRVAGMHAVCTEVTGELLAARRQQLLHSLSVASAELGDARQTVASMCAALAEDPLDIPFAAVYLATGEGAFARVAVTGVDDGLLPEAGGADAVLPPVASLGLTGGPWGDRVTDAVVLPLGAGRDAEPVGLLVLGTSPNRALDADYTSFHELVAGQFAGALGTVRAFEVERQRAESLAELDRAKTTFFTDVSHELRTPLTLLLGPLQDVLDDPDAVLTPDVREQVALAVRSGRRLRRLVDDLLDFAGIEAGRATPVRVPTDVAAFTAELAGIFRSAAERAGLRLTVDCPPLDRPAHVDPRMWEKIVVNLLANAVKYTFVGGIDVALRGGDGRFELTVADTGVGIVAEELPQLFQRFHRVAGAAARTREGTGIGLALVQELAALHGGAVTVTSEPGRGSTFTVALPFGEPDAADGPAAVPSDAAHGEAEGWEEVGSRPSGRPEDPDAADVLVVDDNADLRGYLTRLLQPFYAVRTAADGAEALAAVAARRPALVLTDVMMPRVDGFGLLRELRADPATRDLPVIMLTARAGQEASVEGLEAGADDYLAKPFRAAELLARVRVALERAGGRAAAPAAPPEVASSTRPATSPLPAPLASTHVERPGPGADAVPAPRAGDATGSGSRARWRLPSALSSIPVVRRRLRVLLAEAGVGEEQAYDLLVAACEATSNAIEHAQDPTEPVVEVTALVEGGLVEITVRDHGQWRERVPSMDRGRGSTLMSAFAEVTAVPSPEGTTVRIRSAVRPPA
ncbi:response regulator [Blastococcus sp. MG754426]|uniref:ATP-binding protein n=1 Tax=unclassified Blastococcus TaxID=2619396 RepID=UPI001EF021F8|nr:MULTISPECIES: ATP-binding protein [unclassified Blastococcus]MCF6506135.1 response regulator [Blastococcus sp. MG754426]MCF6510487.1 response regulator [Blastococcus sp. MG754427]